MYIGYKTFFDTPVRNLISLRHINIQRTTNTYLPQFSLPIVTLLAGFK